MPLLTPTFVSIAPVASPFPFRTSRSFICPTPPLICHRRPSRFSTVNIIMGNRPPSNDGNTVSVLVPIATGSEDIEASSIIDVLLRAGANVTVASAAPDRIVSMANGSKFLADAMIHDCEGPYDAIVLPGGMPGAENLRDCEHLKRLTLAAQSQGALIGAICAAPAVVLNSWRIIDQHPATSYPHPSLTSQISNVVDDPVVVSNNGKLVTGNGPGNSIQFALTIAKQLFGEDVAKEKASDLLFNNTLNVLVPIATGSEEVETAAIVDVLNRAGANVTIASASEKNTVKMMNGMTYVADVMVSECKGPYDAIVFPGGMPGAANLRDNKHLKELTLAHYKDSKLIAAICASPAYVLSPWGILKDEATCYPHEMFTSEVADHRPAEVVISNSGKLVTGNGPNNAIKFALAVVGQLYGKDVADEHAAAMLVKRG